MRIGDKATFLSIERRDSVDPYSAFSVIAQTSTGSGWEFQATHETVMFDTSDETKQSLSGFQALKSDAIEIPASEDGWLRLTRDARGLICVSYRIARAKVRAAIEGEVFVDGEYGDRFCGELQRLLWPGP